MPVRLHVRLLGALEAVCDDQPASRFRTQRSAALLAYLALFPDRAHARDTVVESLWPDVDPEAGRARLRTELAALRKSLGEACGNGHVIEADRSSLRLIPGAWRVDVQDMRDALSAARTAAAEAKAELLERACGLYRGPLLPDMYDEWIGLERDRLATEYRLALRDLAQSLCDAGRADDAIAAARRAVEEDPLDEEACCCLMRICLSLEQSTAALRHFREYERRLADDLDTLPGLEAQALAAQAKAQGANGNGGNGRRQAEPATRPAADLSFEAPSRETWLPEWTPAARSNVPAGGRRSQRMRRALVSVVVVVMAVLLWADGARWQEQRAAAQPGKRRSVEYRITDLGTLGGSSAEATDMNDRGEVVGVSDLPGDTGAEGWIARPGPDGRYEMRGVGQIPGFDRTRALAINQKGQVAVSGERADETRSRAAIWLPVPDYGFAAGLQPLALLADSAYACDLNDTGVISGDARRSSRDRSQPAIFRLEAGKASATILPGFESGRARLLEPSGAVVTQGPLADGTRGRPCRIDRAKRSVVRVPPAGDAIILSANASGACVGQYSSHSGGSSAVVFNQGLMAPLPDLGGPTAAAFAINDQGVIVGTSQVEGGPRSAVRWKSGRAQDLNDLIDPSLGWRLEFAVAVNRRGQIAGHGVARGKRRAFVLTPIP